MKATVRFIRHGGICRSDVLSNLKDQGRSAAFRTGPAPAKRTRRKFPRPTHRRDEFRPAIPQRGARQHCPSPLHRHHQLKTIAALKENIYHRTVNSLLTVCLSPEGKRTFSLCRASYSLAVTVPTTQSTKTLSVCHPSASSKLLRDTTACSVMSMRISAEQRLV
jgi:hypothetical protein